MDSLEKETKKLERLYCVILHQYNIISQEILQRALKNLEEIRKSGAKKELPDYLMELKLLSPKQHDMIAKRIRKYVECDQRTTQTEGTLAKTKKKKAKFTSFGHFKILHKVATGAMGVIYKVEDTRTGEILALKLLLAGADAKKRQVLRFDREARYAAKVDYEGVVSLRETGEIGGTQYIAMDFIEGPTLNEYWEDHPTQSVEEVARIGGAIAQALHHIHEEGVVHRDIKPANILMDTSITPAIPKITDFSLAMVSDPREKRLTQTGVTVGTPYYMSPEQTYGIRQEVGPHSDMYSLGVVLYEMLCGHPPSRAKSLKELYHKIQKQPPASICKINPRVNRELEKIIFQALEKNPKARFANCGEMAQALHQHLRGEKRVREIPQWLYRFQDFLRLHRPHLIKIGLVVAVLLLLLWPLRNWFQGNSSQEEALLLVKQAKQLGEREQRKQAKKKLLQALRIAPNLKVAQDYLNALYQEKETSSQQAHLHNIFAQPVATAKEGNYELALYQTGKVLQKHTLPPHFENLLWQLSEDLQEQESKKFWQHYGTLCNLPLYHYLCAIKQSPSEDKLLLGLAIFLAGYPMKSLQALQHPYSPELLGEFLRGQLLWLLGEEETGRKILQHLDSPIFRSDHSKSPLLLLAKGKIPSAYYQSQELYRQDAFKWALVAGLVARELKLYSLAQTYFRQISQTNSEYHRCAQYYLALSLFEMNELSSAIQLLDKLLQQHPAFELAHYQMAWLCSLRIGNDPSYRKKTQLHLSRLATLREQKRLDIAEIYLRLGDYQQAQEYLLTAKGARKYYLQAQLAFEQQHYQQARREITKTLKLAPNHAQAYLLLGAVEEKQNNQKQAKQAYYQALWLAPSEDLREKSYQKWAQVVLKEEKYWEFGLILSIQKLYPDLPLPSSLAGDLQTAKQNLQTKLHHNPDNIWLKAQQAAIWYFLGDKEPSRALWSFLQEQRAWFPLALLQLLDQQPHRAKESMENFLQNSPQSLEGNFLKVQILLALNNSASLRQAQKQLQRIEQLSRPYAYRASFAICVNELATKLVANYNPSRAVQTLKEYLLLQEQNLLHQKANSYLKLALAYRKLSKHNLAAESYQTAMEVEPQWLISYWQAGQFYEELSRMPGHEQAYQTARKLYQLALVLAKEKNELTMTTRLQDYLNKMEEQKTLSPEQE